MSSRRSSSRLVFFVVLAVAGILGGVYARKAEWHKPVFRVTPLGPKASIHTLFHVEAQDPDSGVRSLKVTLRDATSAPPRVVLEKRYDDLPEVKESFSLESLGLRDGNATLEVAVTDASWHRLGFGNTARLELPLVLDSVPPVVSVLSRQHNVVYGGSGLVVYSANEPLGPSGVQVGQTFFPGYLERPGRYVCFFALPLSEDPKATQRILVAQDEAGNEVRIPLNVHVIPKTYRHDSIRISDAFLQSKMPQFASLYPPGTSVIDIFLRVNSELRRDNIAQLKALGANTVPQMLWSGPFVRMPRSAPMAQFGDTRTYVYEGKEVDTQTHMGVDLASLANSPVPAGNTGRVVYADFLGIYGNLVVLDHGFGVHSVYSHLSEIHVRPGEMVQRGQIIGKTGATGMAGGDHLHFGMLVGGIEVQPIEWWDSKWIEDNIFSKLRL